MTGTGTKYPDRAYLSATTQRPHRGAIRCGDDWRHPLVTLWTCQHDHASAEEAVACAAREIRGEAAADGIRPAAPTSSGSSMP